MDRLLKLGRFGLDTGQPRAANERVVSATADCNQLRALRALLVAEGITETMWGLGNTTAFGEWCVSRKAPPPPAFLRVPKGTLGHFRRESSFIALGHAGIARSWGLPLVRLAGWQAGWHFLGFLLRIVPAADLPCPL